MDTREAEFLKRLEAVFKIEAEEHIQTLSSFLIELEKKPDPQKLAELIETIFREAHSLKGAARSVNRSDIESICRVMENVFSKVKNNQFVLFPEHFDILHSSIEYISKLMSRSETISADYHDGLIKQLQSIIETDQVSSKKEESINVLKIITETEPKVEQFHEKKQVPKIIDEIKPQSPISKPSPRKYKKSEQTPSPDHRISPSETVRIETAKLDPLFLQAEQLIQSKIAAAERVTETTKVFDYIRLWKSELRNRISQKPSGEPITYAEILSWNSRKQNELEAIVYRLVNAIENDQRSLTRMIDEHLESMKTILMLPISSLIEGFPKLVRDLARTQGKEVELNIHGQEIEVDKRILQELKDPLIHLLRNCIDHGIQSPDIRKKLKKPSKGIISIDFASTDGRNLEIKISDDGAGINKNKVMASAIKAGAISQIESQKLTDQEIFAFIFNSGISTSALITDISGRGLGLAIVNEKVDLLNGTISVSSHQDQGTMFHLILPLTLSTLRGVLVSSEGHFFFVPNIHVKHVLRVNVNDIKTVENRDTITIDHEIMSIVKLSEVLGLKIKLKGLGSNRNDDSPNSSFKQIIVLNNANRQLGFVVDEVLDEHQILIKDLGKQLKSVRNISGVTALGSGNLIPVINVSDLMKSSINAGKTSILSEEAISEEKIYKILVTEDSITSRTLIKDILETGGYQVETAVDGLDGYTKALIGEFDLIVSDVDMPRMNGFELTTKIRNDKKLSELPIVLVTALDSREDREHGIDVGANAYIIKNSFDQSNLLEVVRKLL
ncbi:MAG: hybrid sensor histidine kinase/response regulator [Bacteroidetes bacterium HGW-Bacteroidetes-17]|jgi:two-component system chemotaxis sensor kinase CheA|nr:MAG: hybrid sensor histidine kinase/response regulator [Bacteroidetes bacterium HGW-Bacteroidetes-17]